MENPFESTSVGEIPGGDERTALNARHAMNKDILVSLYGIVYLVSQLIKNMSFDGSFFWDLLPYVDYDIEASLRAR